VRRAALAIVIALAWTQAALAGIHGNVNVNYFTSHISTEGQPSTSSQTLLQNYLLDVEGPITPKLSYAGYLRATRVEQNNTLSGIEQDRFFTTFEPELQLTLRDPIYSVTSGYRRTESWTGADFDDHERQTQNFYFARLGISPLRLPAISLQYDRLESFDYRNPMRLNEVDNNLLVDLNYTWQAWRAYYSFNYIAAEDQAGSSIGGLGETTTTNHLGRLDYTNIFVGKLPLSVSYQVNSFDTETSGTAPGGGATQLSGVSPGFALANQPAGPRFTDLTMSATISVTLDATGRNIGFQLPATAVCDRIVLDLDQLGGGLPTTWQVYARNIGDSSWTFLAEVDVARSGNTYTIDFTNSQLFTFYKVVNTTVDLGSRVAGIRAFLRQAAGTTTPSATISQSLNLNAGYQLAPDLSFTFNFFVDKQDLGADNYFSSLGNFFPSMFSSSVERPGGANSTSSVNRTLGPSLRWLPAAWMAATVNYQRQDSFDSRGLNDVGGNTYSAIFNFAPLETLDTTLSVVRSEQDVRQNIEGQPEAHTTTASNSYLASFTARVLEGLDWVSDFGYTNSERDNRADPMVATDTYFVHGAFNAQFTPKLFSTVSYSLNWSYAGEETTVTRVGSLVLSYRPTSRVNASYSVSGSTSGASQLLAQSLAMDWLVLPAIHLHAAGTLARTWPEDVTDQTLLGQLVYYINRYADLQLGYTFNRSSNLEETLTHSFNLFFNGRF